MSLPLPSCALVLTLFTSILNHFSFSLIVPIALGMITLAIPSVNGIISAAVVFEYVIMIQFSCRFHLTAVTTWLSGTVMPYNNLGNISDIFHSNNQNHQLERRVQSPRSVS